MTRTFTALSLVLAVGACTTVPDVLPFEIKTVEPVAETAPMIGVGDRADDPAIWVSDSEDQPSIILGTNKDEGLHVYALSGEELQFLDVGQVNNVDIRGRFAVASNDEFNTLTWFNISRDASAPVVHLGETPVDKVEPYGACLGQDQDGLVAAATYKDGTIQFWRADMGKDTPITASLERTVKLESQLEGCVFDETQGLIFIGEETFGLWSLAYRDAKAEPQVVDTIAASNGLVEDVEGVSIWWAQDGGYLIASAQAADRFVVYDRLPPHAPRGIFQISASADGGIDSVSHTDGLDVVSASLPAFPRGLLVVQDDGNPESGVDQNFKLIDWNAVLVALGLTDSAAE